MATLDFWRGGSPPKQKLTKPLSDNEIVEICRFILAELGTWESLIFWKAWAFDNAAEVNIKHFSSM